MAATTATTHESDAQLEKLSIYPRPASDILLVETPSSLENNIALARRRITKAYCDTHGRVQNLVSKWIAVEHAVESRVKSIISPTESLTPGLLYVGTATLCGSILARNRFLPTRLLLPPALFAISANHFLPQTATNLSAYLSSLEETYFPVFSQKHDVANAHTRMTWERIMDATENGRDWVNRGGESVVEKVQKVTGLKLRETLNRSQAFAQQAEGKSLDVVKAVQVKIHEMGDISDRETDEVKAEIERKAAETKRLV